MKFGLLGDLHVDIGDKNVRFDFVENVIKEFKQKCLEEDVDFIVILGDLFHAKVITSTDILIRVSEIINDLAQDFEDTFILVGNHDRASYTETNLSLPNIFKGNPQIKVFDKLGSAYFNKQNTTLHFLPYFKDEIIVDTLKNIKKNPGENYLFGHFGINGFVMQGSKGVDYQSKCSPKHLNGFDQTFLGHYHGYQTKFNVTYVGSPLQLRHGDEDMPHGFVIFNTTSSLGHEFYKSELPPTYVSMKLNKTNYEKLLKLKDSYIRIFQTKKLDNKKLISLRDKLLKHNYDVTFVKDYEEKHELSVVEGWDEIIKQDAESTFDTFLDKQEKILKENGWTKKEMLELILTK